MKEVSINSMSLVPITRDELVEIRDELIEIYRTPDSFIGRFTMKRRMSDLRKNLTVVKAKLEAVEQLLDATGKRRNKDMQEQFYTLYSSVYELVIHFNVVVPIVKKKYSNCSSIRTIKMESVEDYFEGGDYDDSLTYTDYKKSDIHKLLKKYDDRASKNDLSFLKKYR